MSNDNAMWRLGAMGLKYWYLLCLILGLSLSAHAQGVSISGQAIVNTPTSVSGIPGNSVLQVVPNAKITVCTATGGGIPCSPLVTIYSNIALTVVAPNPFTADLNGNFSFFVPANAAGYIYTQTGPGIAGQLFFVAPGAAGPAGPAGPQGPGGTLTSNSGITVGGNAILKGPNPWSDITAFGARATNGPQSTTASFTSGNAQITVASAIYQTGDGVTLQGAGATPTMATPAAPTVAGILAAGPSRDHLTVPAPAGASTYKVCIVAEDLGQGLTACSPTTTLNTGPPTIGLLTQTITSQSLSNDTLTTNYSGGATLANGAMVDVAGAAPRFTGEMKINAASAGSFTVTNYAYDSRVTAANGLDAPNSITGSGTVYYYEGIGITWSVVSGTRIRRYWICMQRPADGGFHVIGQSDLTAGSWMGNAFEDWGSAYMANQSFPYYITDAICTGAGQKDALTTTVALGGGTTTPTLAIAPTQTDNSNTKAIYLDAAPALAAANTVSSNGSGCTFIPPNAIVANSFHVMSYLTISGCIVQSGSVTTEDTIDFAGGQWWGNFNSGGTPQFAFSRGAVIVDTTGNPALRFESTGLTMSNVELLSLANGSTLIDDDSTNSVLNLVNCETFGGSGSNNDTLGECIVYRNTSATISEHKILGGSSFSSGIAQATAASWTPLIDMPYGQNGFGAGQVSGEKLEIDHFSGNRRSISYVSGFGVQLRSYYIQGNLTPGVTFTPQAGGNFLIKIDDYIGDTTGEPAVADIGTGANIYMSDIVSSSAVNPIISGARPQILLQTGYFYSGIAAPSNRWNFNCATLGAISGPYEGVNSPPKAIPQQVCNMSNLFYMGGGYALYWPLTAPAAPTVGAATAGGSVPSGTFVYALSATGLDGGETILSQAPSSSVTTSGTCPGSGNCTVPVSWTAEIGALSYNVWRCAGTCTSTSGGTTGGQNWFEVASHVTGLSFNDTVNAPTNPNYAFVTGTGISGMNPGMAWAPQFTAVPSTFAQLPSAASGIGQYRVINDSTTVAAEGQNCVGGGTNTAMAFSNGTVWKCF